MMKRLTGLVGVVGVLVMTVVGAHAGSYTFHNNTEQVMETVVTGFARLPAEPFHITNDTGTTWSDFQMTLEGHYLGFDYPFMRFVDLDDPGIYDGPGTALFEDVNGDAHGYDEVMNLSGLSIPNGGSLDFTVDIFGGVFPEGLDEFDILGLPTGTVTIEPPIGRVIDNFEEGPFLLRNLASPVVETTVSGLSSSNVIGGTRKVEVRRFGGGPASAVLDVDVPDLADDAVRFKIAGGSQANMTLRYGEEVGGLAPKNLARGRREFRAIVSGETGAPVSADWVVIVEDTSGTTFSEIFPYTGPGDNVFPFSAFKPVPDFTHVTSVGFALRGTAAASSASYDISLIYIPEAALLGDMDLNDLVDFDDIHAFVLALSNAEAYEAQYGVPTWFCGDTSGDGIHDFDDIASFVAILGGGLLGAPSRAVPEPASGSLALLSLLGLVVFRTAKRQRLI